MARKPARLLIAAAAFALLATGGLSGCATVENPFFSVSSDSPVPFFGGSIRLPNKLPGR